MKKTTLYFLASVCFITFLFCCKPAPEKIDREETGKYKTRIVLVNPHLWYLKSFIYLIEEDIIDIPDLELMAIVYARSKHEYVEMKRFLGENHYPYVRLQKIDGNLRQDELFNENACSEKFHDLFSNSEGILFLGGDDIQPSAYEQKTSLLTDIKNPHRHDFELSFLFHLLGGDQNTDFLPYLEENPDYVVYGFCLGLQTMNVATGGSLYQDIPYEIYGLEYAEDVLNLESDLQHRNYYHFLFPADDLSGFRFHRIQILKDQFFDRDLELHPEEQPLVCSGHHQGIKDLGKGFKVAATSLDGKVIEAIEHQRYKNVIGVQFHPEFYYLFSAEDEKYKRSPGDEELLSYLEILKNSNSLSFHRKFWEHFSSLFSEAEEN